MASSRRGPRSGRNRRPRRGSAAGSTPPLLQVRGLDRWIVPANRPEPAQGRRRAGYGPFDVGGKQAGPRTTSVPEDEHKRTSHVYWAPGHRPEVTTARRSTQNTTATATMTPTATFTYQGCLPVPALLYQGATLPAVPAATSSTHSGQSAGGAGQEGCVRQPGSGVHPAGGRGQVGGGLNRNRPRTTGGRSADSSFTIRSPLVRQHPCASQPALSRAEHTHGATAHRTNRGASPKCGSPAATKILSTSTMRATIL